MTEQYSPASASGPLPTTAPQRPDLSWQNIWDTGVMRGILVVATIAVLAVGVWARWENFRWYNGANYDHYGHQLYTWHIYGARRVPTYKAFGIGYHPPAYYLLVGYIMYEYPGVIDTGWTPHHPDQAGRLVSMASSMLILVATALFGWIFLPRQLLIPLFAVAYIAFIPVSLYIGTSLTNEVFYACLVSFFLLFWILDLQEDRYVTLNTLCAGIIGGLAFLTKYSFFAMVLTLGAMPFVSVLWRRWKVRYDIVKCLTIAGIVLFSASWFYLSNIQNFGYPFPTDLAKQPLLKGRELSFFTTIDPRTFTDPFFTQDTLDSFWSYLHVTAFFDFVGFFIDDSPRLRHPDGNDAFMFHQFAKVSRDTMEKGVWLIRAGTFFTLVLVFGVLVAAWRTIRSGKFLPYGPILVYLGVTFAGFSAYVTQHPFDLSNVVVKASYLLSLSLPFGIFFGVGAATLTRWAPVGFYFVTFHFGYLWWIVRDVYILNENSSPPW